MIPSPFHGIFSSAFRSDSQSDALKGHAHADIPIQEPHGVHRKKEAASSQVFPLPKQSASQGRTVGVGQVALDIFEYDDYYILKAPIAGVRLSDLDIEVNDNVLTIRGNRRQNDAIPDDQYYLKECFWGEFQRSVTLPCSIDPRHVKATFNKDCILKIFVPKKDEKVKITRISE